MNRRHFLQVRRVLALASGALLPAASLTWAAAPAGARYRNLLVLIELKGGNDGLNTLVPYANPTYYALRPKLAIPRDQVIQLSDTCGLASRARAVAAALEEPRAGGAPGRRLSRSQSVAFPFDRNLGYRLEQRAVSAGWLAYPDLCRGADAGGVCRRRRDHRLARSGSVGRRRDTRHRARQCRTVPAPGAAGRSRRPDAQPRAAAHPEGRGRHHAGGLAPERRLRVQDRVSRRAASATPSRPPARSSPTRPGSPSCA